MPTSEMLRRRLVRELAAKGSKMSRPVRDAFLSVPREAFVPEVAASRGLDAVYKPFEALVTKTDSRGAAISSSSAPSIMAPMLEHLDLELGHRVLEIGAGTGYNAALLRTIVGPKGRVTTVDIDPDTVARARRALRSTGRRVHVRLGDGRRGWSADAPFDRVIVTASTSDIYRAWHRQLRPDGLLQVPLTLVTGTFGPQLVVTFAKQRDGFRSVRVVPGGFMNLRRAPGADAPEVPRLTIDQRGFGRTPVTVAVAGDAVARLSESARRRLIRALASNGRRRVVARGTEAAGGLALYVAMAAPAARRVESAVMWGTGIVERSGAGIAFLSGRSAGERPPTFSVVAYGTKGAERQLLALVDAWRADGRPTLQQLTIDVAFGERRRGAWRTSARGDAILSFDWSPPSGRS
jgi:protein-L-isoaspartate(D-aspartate) O-methyltransferase